MADSRSKLFGARSPEGTPRQAWAHTLGSSVHPEMWQKRMLCLGIPHFTLGRAPADPSMCNITGLARALVWERCLEQTPIICFSGFKIVFSEDSVAELFCQYEFCSPKVHIYFKDTGTASCSLVRPSMNAFASCLYFRINGLWLSGWIKSLCYPIPGLFYCFRASVDQRVPRPGGPGDTTEPSLG